MTKKRILLFVFIVTFCWAVEAGRDILWQYFTYPPPSSRIFVRAQSTPVDDSRNEVTKRANPLWKLDPFGDLMLWGRPRRSFLDSIDRIERQLGKEFGNFLSETSPIARAQLPVDFIEDDKSYSLELDIPGVQEGDVKVSIDDDILTITAERKEVKEWESSTFHRKERSFGKLQRSMMVPSNADSSTINAKYRNGVLCITMQKVEGEEKKEKTIDIEFDSPSNHSKDIKPIEGGTKSEKK